jgi:hypothetical protein
MGRLQDDEEGGRFAPTRVRKLHSCKDGNLLVKQLTRRTSKRIPDRPGLHSGKDDGLPQGSRILELACCCRTVQRHSVSVVPALCLAAYR